MAEKAPAMTPEEQRLKFERRVREMTVAGELNPMEAAERLDRIVKASGKPTRS